MFVKYFNNRILSSIVLAMALALALAAPLPVSDFRIDFLDSQTLICLKFCSLAMRFVFIYSYKASKIIKTSY